jgi:hypothetical protein
MKNSCRLEQAAAEAVQRDEGDQRAEAQVSGRIGECEPADDQGAR